MTETTEIEVKETEVTPTIDPWANGKSEPTVITPTAEVKEDVVIEEKDKKIEEEGRVDDKPNKPEAVPGASPKDIPARPEEDKENIKPLEEVKDVIKFANAESEKVFNLLKEGKQDEVFSILSEQKKLAEVDKMSPADVIKLNLQYKNKDFSLSEINDLFDESYFIAELKPQRLDETDEEFTDRKADYDKDVKRIEARIARDAKPAVSELKKLQSEIVLPDITNPQNINQEPTQEELDAQKAETERFLQSVKKDVSDFAGFNATFKDEEVTLNVDYKLNAKEKAEIESVVALSATDAPQFMRELGWLDKDGNINLKQLTQDVALIKNRETVLNTIASEVGNQRHAESVKSIKNIDYSGKKQNGDFGKTPQENAMGFATHFFQNS